MEFILNSKTVKLSEGKNKIDYDTICEIAGINPYLMPMVTIKSRFGDSSLIRGQQTIITDDIIVNCFVTNNAPK